MRALGVVLLVGCGQGKKDPTNAGTTPTGPTSAETCASGDEIQLALDAGAGPVEVCAGTHQVQLSLPDGAVLEGAGDASEVVLDGGGDWVTVLVGEGSATLRHLTITGGNGDGADTVFLGGGIDAQGATSLTLEDCVIENNTGVIGGIQAPYPPGVSTFTDVVVRDNVGEVVGGLILGSASLTRTTIERNEGVSGVAIGGVHVVGLPDHRAVVTADAETVIRENQGVLWGGGLAVDAFSSWSGAQVLDNSMPDGGGGGIAIFNAIDVSDVVVSGNTALLGGGVFANNCCGGARTVTLSNLTVESNQATESGGGIHWWATDRTLVLDDVTVRANQAPVGAGLMVPDGVVRMNGGRVHGNIASSEGGGLAVAGPGIFQCTDCDFGEDGGADDNAPEDVSVEGIGSWNYGAAAGFECSVGGNGCAAY